jgi:uncharacterized cupredoxin-like copper-binding protein
VRRLAAIVVALAAGAGATAIGYAIDDPAGAEPQAALGPGVVTVDVGIHYSEFSIEALKVHEGTVVRFVVRNDDPINHELIVGDEAVHRRHRTGSERVHPPVPGEVSVGPGETALTFFRFDEPGAIEFACHLAGHYDYGMHGEIRIVTVD